MLRGSLLIRSDHINMMEDYWKPKLAGKPYPKYYAKEMFEKKFNNEECFYNIPDSFYELTEDELQENMAKVIIEDKMRGTITVRNEDDNVVFSIKLPHKKA